MYKHHPRAGRKLICRHLWRHLQKLLAFVHRFIASSSVSRVLLLYSNIVTSRFPRLHRRSVLKLVRESRHLYSHFLVISSLFFTRHDFSVLSVSIYLFGYYMALTKYPTTSLGGRVPPFYNI